MQPDRLRVASIINSYCLTMALSVNQLEQERIPKLQCRKLLTQQIFY